MTRTVPALTLALGLLASHRRVALGQRLNLSFAAHAGYNFNERFGLQFNLPVIYRSFKRPDGAGGPPLSNSIVLTAADRIRAAGPRSSIPIPSEADKIDGSGKCIVPTPVDASDRADPPALSAALMCRTVTGRASQARGRFQARRSRPRAR